MKFTYIQLVLFCVHSLKSFFAYFDSPIARNQTRELGCAIIWVLLTLQ